MGLQKFEDLIVWQKAQEFTVLIYKQFDSTRDFGFNDQICRASISISNNIAEGFDRSSKPDFRRFLYIAMGSNSEVKSIVYLAQKLGYITEIEKISLLEYSNEIGKILNGLIKSINNKLTPSPKI